MKVLLTFLRVAVVGFALFAGGRALYQNRDKLKREWERVNSADGLRNLIGDLPLGRVLGSVGSVRGIASQFGRLKQS